MGGGETGGAAAAAGAAGEHGVDGAVVAAELSTVLPRVLIVSRRTVRKNKFVDFVGEYHLDLILSYGAVPVIVPRVSGLNSFLDSFEPIHGVLLCEGEDIDPTLYDSDVSSLSPEDVEEIRRTHTSDILIDRNKDSIELQLARRCLERNIPYFGICRGSQVLNVACGGSLYQDVEKELSSKGAEVKVRHMNYDDYDGHRHPVRVVEGTPLHEWFKRSLKERSTDMTLNVNSYHHQGVKRLASRFEPMAHAPDGLVEAFYDPDVHNPEEGKFIVGLQFHPERMRHSETESNANGCIESDFDYPDCPRAYQEFVKAVIAYQKRLQSPAKPGKHQAKLDGDMEKERQKLIRSFSLAKHIYEEEQVCKSNNLKIPEALRLTRAKSSRDLEAGAEFLQLNEFDSEQVQRLKQMGATVRSSSILLEKLQFNKQRRSIAKSLMGNLKTHELVDLGDFYKMMSEVAQEMLDVRAKSSASKKLQE